MLEMQVMFIWIAECFTKKEQQREKFNELYVFESHRAKMSRHLFTLAE